MGNNIKYRLHFITAAYIALATHWVSPLGLFLFTELSLGSIHYLYIHVSCDLLPQSRDAQAKFRMKGFRIYKTNKQDYFSVNYKIPYFLKPTLIYLSIFFNVQNGSTNIKFQRHKYCVNYNSIDLQCCYDYIFLGHQEYDNRHFVAGLGHFLPLPSHTRYCTPG